MTKKEINELVDKYFVGDGYSFPECFVNNSVENRVDWESAKILYSLIRHYQPTSGIDFGGSYGFTSSVINAALIKNNKPYTFVVFEKVQKTSDVMKETHKTVFGKHCPKYGKNILNDYRKVPEKIDFAFIDTDHDAFLTYWYLAYIFPRFTKEALIGIHDWSAAEEAGNIIRKKSKVFPETNILLSLYQNGALPLQKLYWTFENYPEVGEDLRPETSFWLAKGGENK